jgi:polygalacturonase
MTSSSGPKKKKYDFLNKRGTVRTRQDFIETSYINGVKNDAGEEVMRALTKEERQWLSQFYAETEHCNFKNNSELKRQTKKLKDLKRQYKKLGKKENVEAMETKSSEIAKQEAVVRQLREETNCFYADDESRKDIYDRDNSRRRDIYNTSKISNSLVYYDLNEYDKFTTENNQDLSPEDILLESYPNNFVVKKKKA